MDYFGLLNIAKPAGVTSREIVDQIQRLVRPAKTGHAGTLDPLATGVLLVCLGRATRLVPLIHELHKVYRATFLLGRTSQTDDIEGTIVEHPMARQPTLARVLAVLPEFVGRIEQTPPAFSAVRVAGRRAYKLARQGQEVGIAPRPVVVNRIDLLDYRYPEVVLEIECCTGTYIRSIGRDLGTRLGCGAVMSALERTAIGPFTTQTAIASETLSRETVPDLMLPATAATGHLPHMVVDAAGVRALSNGRNVVLGAPRVGRVAQSGDRPQLVAVTDQTGRLVALAEFAGVQLLPRTVFTRRQPAS